MYRVGLSDGSGKEKYIEKREQGLNEKGEVYRRMVPKGMKEVKEQEGREIGLNERGVK